MSIESIMDATRAGLAFERARLDSASRNIAAANVPIPAFDINAQSGTTRAVHDPGNPMADAKGMVHYPSTDLVQEMTTLITASRGYEANVRSFNLLRSMVLKALEIGSR